MRKEMSDDVVHKIFPAFGTINSITIYDSADTAAAECVKRRVLELHRRFSFFETESDVSRINMQAGIRPVSVHEDTFRILSYAVDYARETHGAFDITAGAASRIWREAIASAKMPAEKEIERCRRLTGIQELKLDREACSAFLCRKGQQIDLGGIAKGYAADEAVLILKECGIRHALVNFGGTILSFGEAGCIGIRNPFQKNAGPMAELVVENRAVVTSGCYERGFLWNGRLYHHMIDPDTGRPSNTGLQAVTLVGRHAVELDALATGICILGEKNGFPLLEGRGIEAVFVSDDGAVKITSGLQGHFFMKQ